MYNRRNFQWQTPPQLAQSLLLSMLSLDSGHLLRYCPKPTVSLHRVLFLSRIKISKTSNHKPLCLCNVCARNSESPIMTEQIASVPPFPLSTCTIGSIEVSSHRPLSCHVGGQSHSPLRACRPNDAAAEVLNRTAGPKAPPDQAGLCRRPRLVLLKPFSMPFLFQVKCLRDLVPSVTRHAQQAASSLAHPWCLDLVTLHLLPRPRCHIPRCLNCGVLSNS